MKRTYGTLVLAALVVSLAFIQPASADCILPAGNDCWITQAPATQSTLPAIPAGFFDNTAGHVSDAIPAGTIVKLVGNPLPPATVQALCPDSSRAEMVYPACHIPGLDPLTCHLVAQPVTITDPIDTVVRRLDTMDFDDGTNIARPTGTQVIAISLKSPPTDPLVVTYAGGTDPQNWDVRLDHDPVQSTGTASFTPTARTEADVSGDILVSTLPINAVISFTRGATTLTTSQSLVFNNTAGTFVLPDITTTSSVPTMSTWGLILLVALLLGSSIMLLRRYRRTPGAAV